MDGISPSYALTFRTTQLRKQKGLVFITGLTFLHDHEPEIPCQPRRLL